MFRTALTRAVVLAVGLAAAPSSAPAIIAGAATHDVSGPRAVVVRIESTRGELCSGAVISRQSVLTAAHCMLGGGQFSVISLDQNFRARKHRVARIIIHPTFVPGTTPRTQPGVDLAMIQLAQPLPDDLETVAVGSGLWTGESITIAGYGLSTEGRVATARTLRHARLVAAGTYTSANSVTVAVDEARLGQQSGSGACRGDSGGPALRGGPGSRDLVGIVSWSSGPLAARERRVCGGFTSITPVADHWRWISGTAASLDSGAAPVGSGGTSSAFPFSGANAIVNVQ